MGMGVGGGLSVADGSITTAKLAAGAVTNVKVDAAAAIAQSKLTLSIADADVAAAAAIANTKLAANSVAFGQLVSNYGQGWEFLASSAPAANVATITFSGLTSTYNYYLLDCSAIFTGVNGNESMYLQFNADAGANYDWAGIISNNGAAPAASSGAADSKGVCGLLPGVNADAGLGKTLLFFSKPFSGQYGNWLGFSIKDVGGGGAQWVGIRGGTWKNTTSTITSILVGAYDADNWTANKTRLALYGSRS